jgi:hypothetical protein
MDMGMSMRAVLGSVAVCWVLLLAGCGSGTTVSTPTIATSATGGWNPPRPSGVPDETWEAIQDPATLSNVDLGTWYCHTEMKTNAQIDAKLQEYPGSYVLQLDAYYLYVEAYVEPLCEALPPLPTAKGPASVQVRRL